ncbi:OmpA family protein [Nocardiopsis sp. NPDC050513]|uniref:OmpA family protein n=1 Tax=Nocardiopsis sp. NPDC050513 TaxID=3364338 RepID=UPI0037A25796
MAVVALLLTAGCVVSPESSNSPDEDLPRQSGNTDGNSTDSQIESEVEILASSSTSSTAIGADYQIDIHALERVGNSLIRLKIGVTNNSTSSYFLQDGLSDFNNPYTANRITLLDPTNQTRHLSINQADGSCFCSSLEENIPAGGTADMWVIFPEPPPNVELMTVTTPLTPPILDVPVTESTESVENSDLADPEIIPLTTISDNIEDSTARTESNEEVSIILASDVLFESGSADLNSDALEILEQVAIEIDDASSAAVNIDGYADNTGNESVNVPLSQERAEAVEDQLVDLVSRDGVSFEVAGHGSAEPIADNDTDEGRERNRRVTVTFAK